MKIKVERTVGLPIHPAVHHAMNVVDRVWRKVTGDHPIVTGISEEGHSKGSRHYGILGDIRCRAFDIRSSELTQEEQTKISAELNVRLAAGREYDLVWERLHLHIEYDPK